MKPEHLAREYGDQFQDASIVERYRKRPPYQTELIDLLLSKLPDSSARVLDLGCGTGEVSIPLAQAGCSVDAVDPSEGMVALGAEASSAVNWHHAYAEEFTYPQDAKGKYDLIVTANSLHWMDWNIVFKKFKHALKPNGQLAVITGGEMFGLPVQNSVFDLVKTYSTNQKFEPFSLVDLITQGGYFECQVTEKTTPTDLEQTVSDYIESIHARNGFSMERMGQNKAVEFDAELRRVLLTCAQQEVIRGKVQATVSFGLPQG